jgi:PAS domain S-box-containing protein
MVGVEERAHTMRRSAGHSPGRRAHRAARLIRLGRRVEQALRESEERYRAVVQQVAEAIFLLDPESMCLLEANPAFLELFGYSESEVPNLSVYDLLPYERERVDRTTKRVLSQGTYHVADRTYRLAGKTAPWFASR